MQQTPAMNTEKSILVERLKEASLSLRRFLKVNEEKKAFETEWQNHLYTPEEIKNYPRWGINGCDGLVLVDVDKEKMIDIFRTKLPSTFETISPRRKLPHFYYKVGGGEVENKVLHLPGEKEGAGEIRAANHYLVAPGTIITYKDVKSGEEKTGKYLILHNRPIAIVSFNRFMKVITPFLGADASQIITYKKMREGVPQGTRHQQGMKYASFLVKVQKFDAATALNELKRWNLLCKPPMPENDLERMVKNALRYPDRKPEKLDNSVAEEVPENVQREVTLKEISDVLSTTIKKDETAKLITFLGMLLTYTDEDQQNIGFKSESCRGKSYIPLEICLYYPQEDVKRTAYCSPTAFFHEWGDWDAENKVNVIDLSKKILIFMDQPHDNLLVRLRPLLSHDHRELLHKITDKTSKYGMRAKHVLIRGFPTVIFCTTAMRIDDQEKTRLLVLSPEATKEKIEEALDLLAERLGNRDAFKKQLEADPKRRWLMARVEDIKKANIKNIVIPNVHEICERFKTYREHLIPRHQRDFPRLIALIKAHALLNCRQRESNDENQTIIANETDIQAGFKLYEKIVVPNELGISPEILEIWEKAIKPAFTYDSVLEKYEGLTRKEVMEAYSAVFHRLLSSKRLIREIIPSLAYAGFVIEEINPTNKREKIITPIIDPRKAGVEIYTPEGCTKQSTGTKHKPEAIEYPKLSTPLKGIYSKTTVDAVVSKGFPEDSEHLLTCGNCVCFRTEACVQERPRQIMPTATYAGECVKYERKGVE